MLSKSFIKTFVRRQSVARHVTATFYRATYASTVLAVILCLSVRASVCLSVRLSVTSRSCTKMAKPTITLTTLHDSQGL